MFSANEIKLIKSALRPFEDSGLLTAGTIGKFMENIAGGAEKPQRPDLLTRREVAQILKCTPRSIINYEKSGNLKPIKVAGKRMVRYFFSDIENLLQTVAK